MPATDGLRLLPCSELVRVLQPAYRPCEHFGGSCQGIARWQPAQGHVPRGFTGAFSVLADIDLVLIAAEPGDPFASEHYDSGRGPEEMIEHLAAVAFRHNTDVVSQYSRNLRTILDTCWPGLTLYRQLERTWLTESYLCSAPKESGKVPAVSTAVCAGTYLRPQLELLRDRAIVACGRKAEHRVRYLGLVPGRDFLPVGAIAPPGGNKKESRDSWQTIPEWIASKRVARGLPACRGAD